MRKYMQFLLPKTCRYKLNFRYVIYMLFFTYGIATLSHCVTQYHHTCEATKDLSMSFNHSPKGTLNNVTSLSLHMASLILIAVKARITVKLFNPVRQEY